MQQIAPRVCRESVILTVFELGTDVLKAPGQRDGWIKRDRLD